MSNKSGPSDNSQNKSVRLQQAGSPEDAEDSGEPLNALPVPLPTDVLPNRVPDPASIFDFAASRSDASSTSSSSYIERRDEHTGLPPYPHLRHTQRRTKVIAQYAARSPAADPAVIYQATIFASSDKKLEHKLVTYQDDRPFQFATPRSNRTIQGAKIQPEELTAEYDDDDDMRDSQGEDSIAEWAGPVFEVNLFGKAQFWNTTTRKGNHYTIDVNIPETTEDLSLDKVLISSIVLKSHHLLHALKGLVGYYPSFHVALAVSSTVEGYTQINKNGFRINEPYAVVMHHFQSIKQLVDSECSGPHDKDSRNFRLVEIQKRHMQYLYEFAAPLYHANVVPCEQYLAEACPRVTFDMVWYLLKPGTDVYIQSDGIIFTGVVVEVTDGFDRYDTVNLRYSDQNKMWSVNLWHLNTDGARIRRTLKSYTINAYSGLRDVTELPVFPAYIWDAKDKGERRAKILARSRTFFKALRQGNLLAYHDGPLRDTSSYYAGKVMLDYQRGLADSDEASGAFHPVRDACEQYRSYDDILINNSQMHHTSLNPRSYIPDPGARSDVALVGSEKTQDWLAAQRHRSSFAVKLRLSQDENQEVVQELTEHQLLLLHPEVFAYGLKLKQWMVTSVDYIREIVPSSESLSNLIIGEHELQTIRALSNRQNSKTKQWSADFIEGKGSGQIILLHGPPGVGKTYTVEAISEWLHRPLLALTVADIGTLETLVEQQLFKWFDIAEAWNAVLLVDEADIFLERRQNRDLGRNGLVSAFLRRMEYFKGLLFLTTNRVGQIDDAFISRVHVAIGYDTLNAETRKKIWNGFFHKLARERAGRIQIAPDAKKWVLETTGESQAQLNGRDIRNALQTAITLAEFESEEDPDYTLEMVIIVTKDHFQRVLDMSNKFHNYVTSIRREDERKRAQGRGDRNDYDGCEVPPNRVSIARDRLISA